MERLSKNAKLIQDIAGGHLHPMQAFAQAKTFAGRVRNPILKSESLLLVAEMALKSRNPKQGRARMFLAEALANARSGKDASAAEYVLDTAKRLKVRGFEKYRAELRKLGPEKRRRPRYIERPKNRRWRYKVGERIERLIQRKQWSRVAQELQIESKIEDICFCPCDCVLIFGALYSNGKARQELLPALLPWKNDRDYLLGSLFEHALLHNQSALAQYFLSQVKSTDLQKWFLLGVLYDYST